MGLAGRRAHTWAALTAVCLATGAAVAHADVNQTPIAIPLLGTRGAASPYPSRIHVNPHSGPTQTGQPTIVLQAVTHPCPRDLAVLLVHTLNTTVDKYLLMFNAGGCRPLLGADLIIRDGSPVMPESDSDPTPRVGPVPMGLSVHATAPVFPAPAPAGPFSTTLPSVFLDGDWDLYVIDTAPAERGFIAAGWAFEYSTTTLRRSSPGSVSLPAAGAPLATGPASTYPVTFDLTNLPAGDTVKGVTVEVILTHNFASDVSLALQAPNGESVLLMAGCGGSSALSGTDLVFVDSAASSLPASTLILGGQYKPTGCGRSSRGTLSFPGGPGPVHATTLSSLNGDPAQGVWKLWAYDHAEGDSGSIAFMFLTVITETPPAITITAPTTNTTYTATTPFIRLESTIGPANGGPYSATWSSMVAGQPYQFGPLTIAPDGVTASAIIPLKQGSNFIQVQARNLDGTTATDDVDVTVNEFVYTLSEGATGGFFDLDVTVANPTGSIAPVHVTFLPEHSGSLVYRIDVAPNSLSQLRVDDLTPGDGVSTVVRSTSAVPLAVERTMSWDASGYGGSGGTAILPATQWLFAEGSQGFFDTFILLSNDGADDANATVRFLVEGGSPVDVPIPVPARKRVTLFAGDIAAVRNTSFGLDISADRPITAERSMYFPHVGARVWEGGHQVAGVNAPSRKWFLAEGATGPFFDCFVLLSNPSNTAAQATLTYLLADGTTIPQTITVPANGRQTINVEGVDPRLANAAVSTTITSDVGLIAERSMYWPDVSVGWREAHNSTGVTDAALRWAVADGRLGGERAHQTYILLANPNTTPAEVEVRFLKVGQAPVSRTYTLLPTSRLNIGPDITTPIVGTGNFSADITVLNYQPIVVEKALYWNAGGEVWAAGTGTAGIPIPPPEE